MFFLFDLDGTLTDSNSLWLDVDIAFAERRGLVVTQEYTDFVAHSIFTTAADFTKRYYHLPETPEQIMQEWMELAYDAYTKCPARPGVPDFLRACQAAGIPMGIVTASMPLLCEAALERLGLIGHFRFILYAQELGMEKRNPALWQLAAEKAGQAPSDCVVFDDSPVACAAARAIGCHDVGVQDGLFSASHQEMRRECRQFITDFRNHQPQEFFPQKG